MRLARIGAVCAILSAFGWPSAHSAAEPEAFASESFRQTDYETYFVARVPAPPKELSGLASGVPPATAVSGLKTMAQRARGPSMTPFWFDEGDQLGRYALEVFVNGQSRGVIEYDVVALPGS